MVSGVGKFDLYLFAKLPISLHNSLVVDDAFLHKVDFIIIIVEANLSGPSLEHCTPPYVAFIVWCEITPPKIIEPVT